MWTAYPTVLHFPGIERAGWSVYAQMDVSRRLQGQMLEAMGYAVAPTPSHTVLSRAEVTLKRLGAAGRPCVLLVPAPLKRADIWNLAPGASLAERCIAAGLGVYLVQWEEPASATAGPGLADYGDRLLLECVNAVQDETGERRIFLAGHSLGGTLCGIFSALHPERTLGLVAVISPMHLDFREESGALGPVIGIYGVRVNFSGQSGLKRPGSLCFWGSKRAKLKIGEARGCSPMM